MSSRFSYASAPSRGQLITSAVIRSPNSRAIAFAMNRIGCWPS
jgi:hypothetical protein